MAFRFTSESASPRVTASSSSQPRPIKSPKHFQVHTVTGRPQQKFSVPSGPNWVYASGGSRPVRFDFGKALYEQIASEDETCGSSQEYYARKSASSSPEKNGSFVPPVLPTYNPDPRYMYPTQKPNYAFNFNRATPADVQNMNTALPFGPIPSPERKQKTRKDIDKLPRPSPTQNTFEFGSKHTTFSAPTSPGRPAIQTGPTTLTVRSQNHDGSSRRSAAVKSHMTVGRRT